VYRPQGGCIDRRRAYRQQGGRINNTAGISTTEQVYQQQGGRIDRRRVYQQHGGHINRRWAYQQEAGVSTGSGHINRKRAYQQEAGISTGSGHINRKRAYQQEVGVCIDKGQVDLQRAGVSGVSTGGRVCINNGTFSSFFVVYLVFCRYKSMYLSSLLMNQSPRVVTRVAFYLYIHILPSITTPNHDRL
jgi:hypothetical protein